MWWLAIAPDLREQLEDLTPQLSALLHFSAELDRRLADAGLSGLASVAELQTRLRAALADVDVAELERMLERIALLRGRLDEVAGQLAAIRRLKQRHGA